MPGTWPVGHPRMILLDESAAVLVCTLRMSFLREFHEQCLLEFILKRGSFIKLIIEKSVILRDPCETPVISLFRGLTSRAILLASVWWIAPWMGCLKDVFGRGRQETCDCLAGTSGQKSSWSFVSILSSLGVVVLCLRTQTIELCIYLLYWSSFVTKNNGINTVSTWLKHSSVLTSIQRPGHFSSRRMKIKHDTLAKSAQMRASPTSCIRLPRKSSLESPCRKQQNGGPRTLKFRNLSSLKHNQSVHLRFWYFSTRFYSLPVRRLTSFMVAHEIHVCGALRVIPAKKGKHMLLFFVCSQLDVSHYARTIVRG